MGLEADCRMRYRGRTVEGRAHLETDHLLFRGEERLKVLFRDLTTVGAADGILTLKFAGGAAELELGRSAEKWAAKILHPPSRLDKLGVKPQSVVRLAGEFDDGFRRELEERQAFLAAARAKADLIFLAARSSRDLERAGTLAAGLKPEGALWVIYPKGVEEIREVEVIRAGRESGLKDVKVASFSATETALKFVIPLGAR